MGLQGDGFMFSWHCSLLRYSIKEFEVAMLSDNISVITQYYTAQHFSSDGHSLNSQMVPTALY